MIALKFQKRNQRLDWEKEAETASFRVDKLAKRLGVSIRTLRRRAVRKGRSSVRVTLQEMRLRKALLLLAEGRNVNEASDAVGYAHPCDFTRAFKKFYGVTPSKAHLLPHENTNGFPE